MRPNSLNVNQQSTVVIDLQKFIRDAFTPWRTREVCGVVPAEHLRELFNEFNFSPSERQVTDMLQTAKQFARRYQLDGGKTHLDGLTFGEFCILLADLRGFRTCNIVNNENNELHDNHNDDNNASFGQNLHPNNQRSLKAIEMPKTTTANKPNLHLKLNNNASVNLHNHNTISISSSSSNNSINQRRSNIESNSNNSHFNRGDNASTISVSDRLNGFDPLKSSSSNEESGSTTTLSPKEDESKEQTTGQQPGVVADASMPEVFLGGSCNPTTWRADVAIPTLNELGISFYNPQVSDWTPDLIELEHRAKEKARVLFFVMDSETRASAGAIEAAHIAGQNTKQLVLVLHPYKPNQKILNEPISKQEYIDLTRNQNLLRLLVIRRGLPILDSIPSGLQRTKAILSGLESRPLPTNIASRLISVRRAFDRLVGKNDDEITLQDCRIALSYLGYTTSILSEENIKKILHVHRDITTTAKISKHDGLFRRQISVQKSASSSSSSSASSSGVASTINFEEFCVISAYLSVMQQELNENTCVSPIKGTNLPPPPIFLTNTPEWIHNRSSTISISSLVESSTSASVTNEEGVTIRQKQFYNLRFKSSVSRESQRKRDSGTSSPLPQEHNSKEPHLENGMKNVSGTQLNHRHTAERLRVEDEDDESNDSVFSDASSSSSDSETGVELRDVYLGGSCMRRTRWRQDYVIPALKSKGISFHVPDDLDGTLSMGDIHYLNEVTSEIQTEVGETSQNGTSSKSGDQDDDQLRNLLEEPVFNPALLDASRVLLFVITNETRSLAPMTLAAHYIGLGYDVVLCVQMLTDSIIYGNERLTPTAIKDYNRGREYLMDLAKRQRIPVYNDIQAATECAIEKANMHKSIASI